MLQTNFKKSKKKQFSQPAVSLNGKHYFPQDSYIRDGKLYMAYVYYSRQRKKWFEDTIRLSNDRFTKELFNFAVVCRFIEAIPKNIQTFLYGENTEEDQNLMSETGKDENTYYGREQFASKFEQEFLYKSACNYSLDEWLTYIFICPWENTNMLDGFSLIDKRSGLKLSRMNVCMPKEEVYRLKNNPNLCQVILKQYFCIPFSTITDAELAHLKVLAEQ